MNLKYHLNQMNLTFHYYHLFLNYLKYQPHLVLLLPLVLLVDQLHLVPLLPLVLLSHLKYHLNLMNLKFLNYH